MNARRTRLAAAGSLALATGLAVAACDGMFVEPAPTPSAGVTVSFSLNQAAGGDAQAFDRADAARIRLQRHSGGALAADELVSLTGSVAGREASIEVELSEDPEVFDLSAQLMLAGQPLFAGAVAVTMRRGQTTDAEVSLQPVVASVQLSRSAVMLSAIGESLTLGAYALFASGDTARAVSVQWSSLNTGVVTVSPAGLLTARGEGQTQVLATTGTQSASLPVTVRAVVSSVSVTPAGDTLRVGETLTLSALARDEDLNVLARTPVWSSSAPTVASVDAAGLVRALSAGTATVSATIEGKAGNSLIRVIPVPVASVSVVPSAAIVQVGGSVQLGVEVRTATGELVTRPVQWSSGNQNVATVSATGLVSGIAAGTATISATVEGVTGSALVTVVAPVIGVAPSSLAFTGVQGGANPASQLLNISNPGGGTLAWSVSDDAAWLALGPTSGTNNGSVTVGVNTAGLGAGTYSATITIIGNASNSPRTVPVTLTVTAGPVIGVAPTSLAFSGVQGGANPASQLLNISNPGGGTLAWSVSDDAAWLTLGPTSGTNNGSVTVGVNTAGLGAGTYSATITIIGNASNSPRTVPVTLTVSSSAGTIRGRVSAVTGAPLVSAQVTVNELSRSALTNSIGDYVISAVPPGSYGMTATMTGYLAQAVSNVVVTAGQTTTVNFQLSSLPTPPAAPSSLNAAAVSTSQINLGWTDNATNETSYRIERCTGATCSSFAEIATVGPNVTTYQNAGLTAATNYRYRVRAYNLGGYSAYSNIAAAATQGGTAPVLSAGSYTTYAIDDPNCNLPGYPIGTSFTVRFNYSDADGDVPLTSSAVGGTWVFPAGNSGSVNTTFYVSPSFTGTGYSGTVTTRQCYVFGSNTYVDVTMTLRDAATNTGQLSPIRITKPAGSN